MGLIVAVRGTDPQQLFHPSGLEPAFDTQAQQPSAYTGNYLCKSEQGKEREKMGNREREGGREGEREHGGVKS